MLAPKIKPNFWTNLFLSGRQLGNVKSDARKSFQIRQNKQADNFCDIVTTNILAKHRRETSPINLQTNFRDLLLKQN